MSACSDPLRRALRRAAHRAASVIGCLLGIAVAGCGAGGVSSTTTTRRSADGIPPRLLAEARPIGRSARFHPPARGPVVGRCSARLGVREGVHVEVFAADRVVLLPAGISARPPFTISSGRIMRARCYGALVTLDPTGTVLVRPGRRLSLGDLFGAWGQSLTRHRLLSFTAAPGARVIVYVNGHRWSGPPADVRLARHDEIVLEIGPPVPPHATYAFPPGT